MLIITTPRCGGFEVGERVALDGEWARGIVCFCDLECLLGRILELVGEREHIGYAAAPPRAPVNTWMFCQLSPKLWNGVVGYILVDSLHSPPQ